MTRAAMELPENLLRPRRPRLAEALAAATGLDERDARAVVNGASDAGIAAAACLAGAPMASLDGREAWAAVCTALDLFGWVDEERRSFATRVPVEVTWCKGRGRWRRYKGRVGSAHRAPSTTLRAEEVSDVRVEGHDVEWQGSRACAFGELVLVPATLPYPATVAECLAIASDPRGVLAAEACAREHVRANPQYGQAARRIRWRMLDADDTQLHRMYALLEAEDRKEPEHALVALRELGYDLERVEAETITLLCPALDAGRIESLEWPL